MNNLEIQAQKVDGRLEFRPDDKLAYQVYVDDHPEGKWFNIKVSVAHKPKRIGQPKYYYGTLMPIAMRVLLNAGHTMKVMGIDIPIDKDEADKIVKAFCGRIDDDGNVVMHDPEKHPDRSILKKADASEDQMRELNVNAKRWLEDYWKARIPERTD